MKRIANIDTILRPLTEGPQACLTNALQVADILEWILEQTGKAEVWQTSFSISEEFLRRLFFIEKKGHISSLHLILDLKATNKTLQLWSFLSQVADTVHLADNHSKLILVKAETGETITVLTSQNLTRGNRYEVYTISTDPQIFNDIFASLQYITKEKSVPLDELFARKLGEN